MLIGSMPVTAFAVTGDQVAADGAYTAEAAIVNDPEMTEGDEWEDYSVTVTVTVADGTISSITTTAVKDESEPYLAKAVTKKKGINTLLTGQAATSAVVEGWDAVSGATIVSAAVKAAAIEALGSAAEAVEAVDTYVLMNIPYEKFYENEISDGEKAVDAVSSATGAKTQMYTMFPGTYRNQNGQIDGVVYPVKVPAGVDLSAYTQVTDDAVGTAEWSAHGTPVSQELSGVECLFVNGDYSYYVLAAEPTAYKELSAADNGTFSFAKSTAVVNAAEGVTATLTSSTAYGDFQMSLSGLNYEDIVGIVANTAERSYAFRHLENIWAGGAQAAWTTGFTTAERHGNDLSYMADYYKDIMGQTIASITVYGVDADGSYVTDNYDIEDIYVPKKIGASVTAENIMDTDTALPVAIADDTEGVYTVYSVDGTAVTVADGSADVSALGLAIGNHTVSAADADGLYAPISGSFTVMTDKMPAKYDGEKALVKADDATDEEFAAYIKAIAAVSVKGTNYNASGRGAVRVIGDDGAIDQSKLAYGDNNIVVTATGYPELSFTMRKFFTDVTNPNKWYYTPVYWAATTGVTDGHGEGTFQPDEKLTRAMTVMFLYKLAGRPGVDDLENPFSDVTENDWYYDAVKWAYANQITVGHGAGTFKPYETCTRGMIVTFIKRYAEYIEGNYVAPEKEAPFKDIKSDDWFKDSVDWAYDNQITTGYGTDTYQPYAGCTRGMMVTFLYRLDSLNSGSDTETQPLDA